MEDSVLAPFKWILQGAHNDTYMYMYIYLLDITKQQCCIEWFVSGLYNYVHSSSG